VIGILKIKMQNDQENDLNSNRNRGFDWMLGTESSKKEEQIFNFNLQKSVSIFSRKFQISVNFTGSRNLGEPECTP
jgi:hypothetical protein